jgi:hypothetical protein
LDWLSIGSQPWKCENESATRRNKSMKSAGNPNASEKPRRLG